MDMKVMENIYLLVIVTLISVVQNGEKGHFPLFILKIKKKNCGLKCFLCSVCFEAFFAQKVEKECNSQNIKTSALERVSCAR